ncbi:MAG: primosomal protein N' [Streptosporangiaceae bacterium]
MAAAARQGGKSPSAVRRKPARRPAARRPAPAAELPVARVIVDVPLAHLDRPFDYLVPERFAADAAPGCRVRVRFAGRLVDGYLLDRAAESEHAGGLAFLERVVSPEPVLTAEIASLARTVADRYAGTMADVLRLAIPPRHAAAESAAAESGATAGGPVQTAPRDGDAQGWGQYRAGPAFLAALAGGRAPRAVWSALPGPGWPGQIARAAAAAAGVGRGTAIVVPDVKDLALVDAALTAALGPGRHVSLSADLGPAERYRRWLAVLRGQVAVACGTRSAMFAPVRRLGLVVLWDDGDDLHAEPRAPYPHAREVLALRAYQAGAAALFGGFARTAEGQLLLDSGWARPLQADRAVIRRCAPMIRATGDDAELARDEAARSARLPGLAIRTARAALASGPVLFQVPRRGYLAAVCCERCRALARCGRCGGPVTVPGPAAAPRCGWCGSPASARCPNCGHDGLRALVTGAGRTAEELGRAFPSVPVRTSGRAGILTRVPAAPAIVVATPGAEPRADGGYAAAILLDSWALLGRPSLRAAEEALRRWLTAAALVRPAPDGGTVIVVADAGLPAVQALIRWDPAAHARRELGERQELRFPPAVRMAAVTGAAEAAGAVARAAGLPPAAELLGPVPVAAGPGTVRPSGPPAAGPAGHSPAGPGQAGAGPGGHVQPGHGAGGPGQAGASPGGHGQPGHGQAGRSRAGDGQPGTASPDGGQPEDQQLLLQSPETVRYLLRVPREESAALAAALQAEQRVRSARKDPRPVRVQLDPAELI